MRSKLDESKKNIDELNEQVSKVEKLEAEITEAIEAKAVLEV